MVAEEHSDNDTGSSVEHGDVRRQPDDPGMPPQSYVQPVYPAWTHWIATGSSVVAIIGVALTWFQLAAADRATREAAERVHEEAIAQGAKLTAEVTNNTGRIDRLISRVDDLQKDVADHQAQDARMVGSFQVLQDEHKALETRVDRFLIGLDGSYWRDGRDGPDAPQDRH